MAVGPVGQPHQIQGLGNLLLDSRPEPLVEEAGGESQGLPGCHVLVVAGILGQVADSTADQVVLLHDIQAENLPIAVGRPCQTQEQLDGGGLPGTIGAQEAADRVRLHLQV